MGRKKQLRLLASELEILDLLWRSGPLGIVDVQQGLSGSPGYTTVQTRLNRMVEKGLVRRSKRRPTKYSAAIRADSVASNDLNTLLDKVSGGRIVPLVAHLVKDRRLSQKEIRELKQLIAEAEARDNSVEKGQK